MTTEQRRDISLPVDVFRKVRRLARERRISLSKAMELIADSLPESAQSATETNEDN